MPTFPYFRRRRLILGNVDHTSHRIARGWAFSPDMPKRRLQLDLFHGDVFLGRVSTGQFRPDLLAHGFGDGRHGFVFPLPADVPTDLDPSQLRAVAAGPVRRLLAPSADDDLPSQDLPASARLMLGPYLAAAREAATPRRIATAPGRRPQIDELCAPDDGEGALATRISAFVGHIARKYERPELASGDEAGLWRWYLEGYVTERSAQLPPLSRGDIHRLSDGDGRPGSYVARLFDHEVGKRDTTYRWAIETSARLGVADCLVAPDAVARLRATRRRDALLAYPLSTFMLIARRETTVLRRLSIRTQAQRRALYALVMIWGLRDPHVLTYLPSRWLHRLLAAPELFEATLVELFGPENAMGRDRYAALVEATGFDLATQTFQARRYDGHRVRGGASVAKADRPVDVQIFGPFSRRLGLGESCRRIAEALACTPFSINLVDYDIGNASPAYPAEQGRFGPPRAARLNILHLNAEEIPEALAYLPDVFAPAPLVAVPYWELSRPAAVHRLGLRVVDEIWAASRFLAEVFGEAGKPVHWIGMSCSGQPVPSEAERQALRARYGLSPRTFVFLTTSDALSWVQRKNPLGVVQAFHAAFTAGEDVALVVKTHNLGSVMTEQQKEHWDQIRALCATGPRTMLVNESLDAPTQRTLLAACDCFVSLHRAEGLGLDALDALALERSVVATAYSGMTDLCTPETSWPVAASMRPVSPQDYCFVEPGHVWAEPSLEDARDAVRGVYFDKARRDQRIAAGKRLVDERATLASQAARLEAKLRAILDQPRRPSST